MAAKTTKRQPKTASAQATRDSILEAAAHILLMKGLDEVNTNAVAERAGVSIGSLYQYFEDKDEIFSELLSNTIQKRFDRVKESISLSMVFGSLEEIVSTIVDALIDYESETEAKIESLLLPHLLSLKGFNWKAQVTQVNDVLKPLIKAALIIKEPKLRNRDISLVSFILIQAIRGIIFGNAFLPEPNLKLKDLKGEVKRLIIAYLRSA